MKLVLQGKGDVTEIAQILKQAVSDSGVSCECVHSVERRCGGSVFYVLVFDKYYYRANNRASLTLVVSGGDGNVTVDSISSGGGQGVFFRFSWGAEKNFARLAEYVLAPLGFETIEEEK